MDFIALTRSASNTSESTFYPEHRSCIICNESDDCVLTTPNGREKIQEAAKVRNDIVSDRLSSLDDDRLFYYHMTNSCYKQYCHKKSLLKLQRDAERSEEEDLVDISPDNEQVRKSTRKRGRYSNPHTPTSPISSTNQLCIVCDKKSHKGIYKKYRICEYSRANEFLKATLYLKDDVFTRTCDLQDESSVFGADILCHDNCISGYFLKYKRKLKLDNIDGIGISTKLLIFSDIAHDIGCGLEQGRGYTLSYIRDQFNIQNDEIKVTNKELKLMLCDYFGDQIKFSKPLEANKPLMFFSSALQSEDVADVIRSCNPVTECASILRESLQNLEFGLIDKFCDAQDLRKSWNGIKIPQVFVTFFSTLFNVDPNCIEDEPTVTEDYEELDDTACKKPTNWNLKSQTLLQIMYYNMLRGTKKTPLHLMVAESIHDKCKSKTLITSFNHVGLCVSYPEVIRHHHNLAQFSILQSKGEVPIPSHFKTDSYTIGAFDNFDHEEATLSGIGGSHDTVCVLFQDKPINIPAKPTISDTEVVHGAKPIQEVLPCQKLQVYFKPAKRPDIPSDYEVDPNLFTEGNNEKKDAEALDLIWCFSRIAHTIFNNCEAPNIEQPVPSWSAFNALCSNESLLTKQVGFLPVVPYPVTQHAAVYTSLLNFNSILSQLDQHYLPVACDEGVYAIAREVQLCNPDKFKNIVLVLGAFHMAKILLRCIGRYVKGTGISNVLIECSIFGVNVVESVLQGKNYARGLKGMLMLGEVFFRLEVASFLNSQSAVPFKSEFENLCQMQQKISSAVENKVDHLDLDVNAENLFKCFREFVDHGRKISEQFLYWDNFLILVQILRNLIRSDRQGLWQLHLDTVQKLQPIFAMFDCINYQRWSSLYLEDMRRLPKTAPEVHEMFLKGKHVVKRNQHKFTAVAADMALEQTINRSQKSSAGIIGRTKQKDFVAEWEITHHERLMISNFFREVTMSIPLVGELNIHHELSKTQTQCSEEKVNKMLTYVLAKGNPFDVTPNPLHNLITNVLVPQAVKEKVLKLFETGDSLYSEFRKTRFEDKTIKISDTIHKVMLPTFDSVNNLTTAAAGKSTKKMSNTAAHRMIQIAQARGYDMEKLFSYELSEDCKLFDENGLLTKSQKSLLVKEIEKFNTNTEIDAPFISNKTSCFIVDVMSCLRKVVTNDKKTFDGAVSAFSAYIKNITKNSGEVDFVFDSYHKLSPKQPERSQRQIGNVVIDISHISKDAELPVQMNSFWGSSRNKLLFQEFIASTIITSLIHTPSTTRYKFSAFSGDEEDGISLNCSSVQNGRQENHSELNVFSVEEADLRMMIHAKCASMQGFTKIALVSADTDIIVLALFHWENFARLGLEELWVRTGVGNTTRLLPIHRIYHNMGQNLCSLLPAIHALSGTDYTSKFGTKKGALNMASDIYLSNFGVSSDCEEVRKCLQPAEEYLVQLLRKGSACKSLDELRLWLYHHGKNIDVDDLPPTSNSSKGHLLRSYFYTYYLHHCLDDVIVDLDPCQFGFEISENGLVPESNVHKYPNDFIGACSCVKCAKSSCICRANELPCCSFCKCMSVKESAGTCKNPF